MPETADDDDHRQLACAALYNSIMQSATLCKFGDAATLLSPKQVAKLLGVSPATVYRLVERRHIAFHRIGSGLRFSHADVASYLAQQRVARLTEHIYERTQIS